MVPGKPPTSNEAISLVTHQLQGHQNRHITSSESWTITLKAPEVLEML